MVKNSDKKPFLVKNEENFRKLMFYDPKSHIFMEKNEGL